MNNPRNLLAQQDVIDSVASTSAINPLSANQGLVLNTKIVDIENEIGQIFNVSIEDYPIADQTIIGLNDIGLLRWDYTESQPYITLSNSNITNFTLFNKTTQFDGVNFFDISDSGTFSVASGFFYYLTGAGTLNTAFDMTSVSKTSVYLFMEGPSLNVTLQLDFVKSSFSNEVSCKGQLISVPTASTLQGISMRCEAVGTFNSNTTQTTIHDAYGDGEQNNKSGSGAIMPENVLFKAYSIDLNGDLATTDVTFILFENGVEVPNTEMTVAAGTGSVTGFFAIAPTIEQGKRLNVGNAVGDGDTTYYLADIVLYGTIEETE